MRVQKSHPPFFLVSLIGLCAMAACASAGVWGFEGERKNWNGVVWEAPMVSFSEQMYQASVEALMANFEEDTGKSLAPSVHGRAAIKIYTNSGPGLDTPHSLTRAVIAALVKRGFSRDRLLIVDASNSQLRDAGYYPLRSERDSTPSFDGVPVVSIDSGELLADGWEYDSPVPLDFTSGLARAIFQPGRDDVARDQQRKSRMPGKIFTSFDFWINLPMVTDHPTLGVNGALVNATLWNVTNRSRFFVSPNNAPVATAEIAAIPELLDTWAFTLMTLESYQFVGGPSFNSLYTDSEPKLWLAVDPVILDALILQRLNARRERWGFRSLGILLPILDYSASLQLGAAFFEEVRLKVVKP
jgi:hypothetical protein|tara:strand:- start:9690 stop:10760 length:1071 start_codon:yes stop_codon:yes gene_type:complete